MKRIAVYCGSSSGYEGIFEEQAYLLGQTLALHQIGLVYGGAKIGLMGAVANGAISQGGEVIGVLPHFLKGKEIAHLELTELILVDTMHQRKTIMNDLSDGMITLPGGFGTMEEFFEMLTWAQLGLHKKPIAILNTNGFYNNLIELIHNMVNKGFLKKLNQDMLLVHEDINTLLTLIQNYKAPVISKWISEEEL